MTNYLRSHPSFIHPGSYSFIRPFTYHPFNHHLFIHASIHSSSEHFTIATHSFCHLFIHHLFIHAPIHSFIHLTNFTLPTLSFYFLLLFNFFTLPYLISQSTRHVYIPELIIHSKDDIHPSIQCHPMSSIDIGQPQL